MPEPTTALASAIAATASTITLALFGVDYYSLLYGFVGALFSMSQAATMGRGRAIVYVVLSTLVGAAFGAAATELVGTASRAALFLGCVVGGAGAQLLVSALLKAALARIDKLGGGQ